MWTAGRPKRSLAPLNPCWELSWTPGNLLGGDGGNIGLRGRQQSLHGHDVGTLHAGALGVANLPDRASFSGPHAATIAHELGHNMNLAHAPCGRAGGPDAAFPYPDGSSGAWGYDASRGSLVRPSTSDVMNYCGPPDWISDYHFSRALRFRLVDERPSLVPPPTAQESESLLLWGGTDAEGEPFSIRPSWSTPHPCSPMPPVSTGSPDGSRVVTSFSPSTSPCPRRPMATGVPPSPSSSRCSPAGRATWRGSHSPDRAARLLWTAIQISR